MEHVARVVVEGEHRSVGIPSVADIPFLHLAAGCVHAKLVVLRPSLCQETLDGRGEEEPVGVRRVDGTEFLEFLNVALLCHLVERHPQLVVGAEEALGNVGGIYKVLSCHSPAEVVARLRVNTVLIACQSPLAQLSALLSLGSVVVGQCEPRCNASHQSSEGLHVDHSFVAGVERGAELCLHVLLQFALCHVFEHRLRHFICQSAPVLSVGLDRLFRFLCSESRSEQHEQSCHNCCQSFHSYIIIMCKDTPFPDNNQEKQRKKRKSPSCSFMDQMGTL